MLVCGVCLCMCVCVCIKCGGIIEQFSQFSKRGKFKKFS